MLIETEWFTKLFIIETYKFPTLISLLVSTSLHQYSPKNNWAKIQNGELEGALLVNLKLKHYILETSLRVL